MKTTIQTTTVSVCVLGSLFAFPLLADAPAMGTAPGTTSGTAPVAAMPASAPTASATPAVVTPPADEGRFVATSFHGRHHMLIGQVRYIKEGQPVTPIVEIPGADGNLTQFQRAQIVANRLKVSDKLSLQRLQPGTKNGEQVLNDPVTGKFIITADRDSAAFYSETPQTYVVDLQKTLMDALSGYIAIRDDKADYELKTPEEKRDRAILYRQRGNDAEESSKEFPKGHKFGGSGSAEALYLHAIAVDPQMASAYLCLCSLYAEANQKDKAKDIYQQAVSAGLDLKAEALNMKAKDMAALMDQLK